MTAERSTLLRLFKFPKSASCFPNVKIANGNDLRILLAICKYQLK